MGKKKKEVEIPPEKIVPIIQTVDVKDISFVGLDASYTGFGLCFRNNGNVILNTIATKPDQFPNDLERLDFIVEKVLSIIPKDSFICLEDVYVGMGAQVGSSMKLMGLAYLLRKALYNAKLPFYIISPSQVKKWILSKGNGSKDQITKEVYRTLGVDTKDDNQADATVLAFMAEDIYKYLKDNKYLNNLVKSKAEVIKTIATERPNYNINLI